MKLVANIQLTPTKADAKHLRDTLERCNAASNVASEVGFEKFGMKVRQANLHKATYHRLREEFELTAQVAVHCGKKAPMPVRRTPNPPGVGKRGGRVSWRVFASTRCVHP
jgi:hypothetical protein